MDSGATFRRRRVSLWTWSAGIGTRYAARPSQCAAHDSRGCREPALMDDRTTSVPISSRHTSAGHSASRSAPPGPVRATVWPRITGARVPGRWLDGNSHRQSDRQHGLVDTRPLTGSALRRRCRISRFRLRLACYRRSQGIIRCTGPRSGCCGAPDTVCSRAPSASSATRWAAVTPLRPVISVRS